MANACSYCFFLNAPATPAIYTLSLHDALPILALAVARDLPRLREPREDLTVLRIDHGQRVGERSEEHTSELQSRQYLVCRLLLEKKKIGLGASLVRRELLPLPSRPLSPQPTDR